MTDLFTTCWCGYEGVSAKDLTQHQLYCDPHNTAPKVIDDQRKRIAELEAQLVEAQKLEPRIAQCWEYVPIRIREILQSKWNQKENKMSNYVIVRTYSAGVFAGTLVSREGKEVTLATARRLWYWEGAASLSQLAQSGTSAPKKCKFPEPVDSIILTEAIEILSVTDAAKANIEGVPVWKV